MATYHTIYVTTKVQNRKKNENYYDFEACHNAREVMEISRMAGKVKEFVHANAIEKKSYGADYNGYGWSSWYYNYLLTPAKAKGLQALIESKNAEKKPPKTEEQIVETWSKRLAKLAHITLEEAKDIAWEKLEAKEDQIDALCNRQYTRRYSTKRAALIRKIERSNPLRRIKDEYHAMNILAASYRHKYTDYDSKLDEYREQAEWGDIDYSEVKAMARGAVVDKVSQYMNKKNGSHQASDRGRGKGSHGEVCSG